MGGEGLEAMGLEVIFKPYPAAIHGSGDLVSTELI